jgi:L,D-transpeptidase catalytic domain
MLLSIVASLVIGSAHASHAPKPGEHLASIQQLVGSDSSTEMAHLSEHAPKLNKNALRLALNAYHKAEKDGSVKNHALTVIDYSLPSNQPRMWVFNMETDALLFKTYVAHGKNSGQSAKATKFSNGESSKETSLGTFITEDTYMGHKGYSLNIKGLTKGFNDHALARRVVVHGAWYVEPSFIKSHGRAGNSWGCQAIAASLAKPVVNTIKHGSVIFAYYPSPKFLQAVA